MEHIHYPSSDTIDPDEAKRLFEYCAFLIIEELPIGSEFGIDLMAYRVGDKFKGVKLIPPGIHFIYASTITSSSTLDAVNSVSTSNCGPRCGFYHNFRPKELLVRRWSTKDEEFDFDHQNEEQLERYRMNLHELDRFLGCYSYSTYRKYLNLTKKLTPEIVDELMPKGKIIRSVPFLTSDETRHNTSSSGRVKKTINTEKQTQEELLPNYKPDKDTVINFTNIPKTHLESQISITHDMITKYNLDSSTKLINTFGKNSEGRNRLLAEMQFSFVTFLLCHVYECFEHWKVILTLICQAREDILENPKFFQQFCDTLFCQICQIPEDLFQDIVDSNNLVRTLLDTFFVNVSEADNSNNCELRKLKEISLKLKNYLEKKFKWQFDLEVDEEEQPVVVPTIN